MEYYRFDDEQRGVVFLRHDMPTPWTNYLSNGSLHAFISQAGGGLCWWKSPSIFRLTRYRMYNLPIDSPGFYVYLRGEDGTVWSPTFRPCETELDSWEGRHRPGITSFAARKNGIGAEISYFIGPGDDVLIWDLALTGDASAARTVDVFAYVELSLHEWLREVTYGCYNKHQLKCRYDEEAAAMLYLYHADGLPRHDDAPLVYLASDRPPESYDGDRDAFVGAYRYERNPLAVQRGACFNSRLEGGEPCAAVHVKVNLEPGRTVRVPFFLGVAPGALVNYDGARATMGRTLRALRASGAVQERRERLEHWWDDHLSAFSCSIPDPDSARQIRIWTPVQSVHTGRYSRSISFYASGVRPTGFRDTCQDMLALVYRKPGLARSVLLKQLGYQFADGHAVHGYHTEEPFPPSAGNVHSDDHLWLPMLAHALVCESGDRALLSEEVPYLAGDTRGAEGSATVWEHLLTAMEFTDTHLGRHGLPLTLKSDWNDIIGKFARKGRGESVFAGQQYAYVLRLMKELAGVVGDRGAMERLQGFLDRQLEALAACAWDGSWWRRGFDDDGAAVGSGEASWGKLFLNPQSWAVLAGCGTPDQRVGGMDQVAAQLDTGMGLQILAPSFKTYPDLTDPFSGYNEGCGENGAIFCHANTWAIIAEALLGRGARAWKYYRQLVPHVALQHVGIERYRAEPYAYVSNILGPDNIRFGFANVSQVTGTAAWMDVAATQYLIGIRAELAGLRIDPCIPPDWKGFEAERRYRGTRLKIRIANPEGVEKGVRSIEVDGRSLEISDAPVVSPDVLEDRDEVAVVVTMGTG